MNKVKNWTIEKKDKIETILISMWVSLGMDIPDNYEDIVQNCYEDVCETADPINWHSGDVAIAFRRWIEAQAKENVQLVPMSEKNNNIWSEIQDDDIVYIDAFLTDDDNEEVKLIAKVNVRTKEVEYLDNRARTNEYAQEVINEALR